MDSLKYWLNKVASNSDGTLLTQWEIEVLFEELIDFTIDRNLEKQILPLLIAIRNRGKSLNHKSIIAKFTLKLITKFEDDCRNTSSVDNF